MKWIEVWIEAWIESIGWCTQCVHVANIHVGFREVGTRKKVVRKQGFVSKGCGCERYIGGM